MEKRGQVAIFIIIAVLIIAGVVIYFLLREPSGEIERREVFTPDVGGINLFVQDCLDQTGELAILFVGKRGGYADSPELSSEEGIPYYYIGNEIYIPSKEAIEGEISKYVNYGVEFCMTDLTNFERLGLEVTPGEAKTTAEILNDSVKITVDYPINVKKGDDVSRIRDFETEVPVRLGLAQYAAEEIVRESLDLGFTCLSCALDLSVENNLTIDIGPYDEGSKLFLITDGQSKINEEDFVFAFLGK